ncbi:hypothetical protein M409DRAFT_26326 [Zasmidium cellare ATCC 36951]|uniref:NAD(P)-binding domain-containing protein n=1 Tax=Zasmidium cellare ATCC 36951 TaxID=1080233 RepID=A0A6A6C825_ZASCE|nr:uncharacterized protein M409DRAFT_26326 [Zasmidium cellare ATCC 36951]KAF2163284.1 hypothetical protein M409DRAFT_26326 [Zasmidium cellare ATCC 36951]
MSIRTIAFFGATGGCANSCLYKTIEQGMNAIVLARSPEKLKGQLEGRKTSREAIEQRLEIVEGDVRDVKAVGKVLENNGRGVDIVISGIGGVPTPQFSLMRPLTMTDPNIWGDAIDCILSVMAHSTLTKHPLLVVISGNGVRNDGPRDYPLMLTPLYRWLLTDIYDDKRRMEASLTKTRPAGGFVIVRASPLTDGTSKGLEVIQKGTMQQPVLGYSISRDDVGLWIFENLVRQQEPSAFLNDEISITY